MSDERATIDALSREFDPAVIQIKPGSARKPATKYVSHGSCTKRLNAVCPGWSSRVVETYTYLDPAGLLVCAGVLLELTIPGVGSRQEFGTANQPRTFGDDAKNAASDALKRAAMRFGVALDLWESMDEHDEDAQEEPSGPPDDLATMGDLAARPEARKAALHRYYSGAETPADLNVRADAAYSTGMDADVLASAYRWHHDRLSKQLAPAGVAV